MGFGVIYIGLLLSLLIVFSHRKHYQNWTATAFEDKLLAAVALMALGLFGILSLMLLFGIFDK